MPLFDLILCFSNNLLNCHFSTYVERDQLGSLLAAFDCGLVGLEHNQTGLSVPSKTVALLAAGVPVIACVDDVSETAFMINENDCGYVCPPKDSRKLAKLILELKEDGIHVYNGTYQEYLDHLGEDHLDTNVALSQNKKPAKTKTKPSRDKAAAPKEKKPGKQKLTRELEKTTLRIEIVEHELEEFLKHDFFQRVGGGIGMTRMISALDLLEAKEKIAA